jgi:hypothetical protein
MGPALAAADQMLALGNQALVQLAGEHGDALRSGNLGLWRLAG